MKSTYLQFCLRRLKFSSRSCANPGEVAKDSNSVIKILDTILNTLPRTLAPKIAIKESYEIIAAIFQVTKKNSSNGKSINMNVVVSHKKSM